VLAIAQSPGERRAKIRFIALAALVVFLALTVRVVYVFAAKVEYPIRGDVNQYVLYAWNLTHRGVFSTSLPEAEVAVPDSYRGPGYPLMLALTMVLAGHSDLPLRLGPDGHMVLGYVMDTWMRYALYLQVICGAATVLLVILLARMWLSRSLTLCVGLAVALWPHLIVFSGTLLSETLFAFAIALSLWLLCLAEKGRNARLMSFASLSFGAAYLINPIILIFPLLVGAVLCIRSDRRLGAALLLPFVLAPLAWGLRNADADGGMGTFEHVAETFVVGSWPQFYKAYNSRFNNEISTQIMQSESEEQTVLVRDPSRGLAMIAARMAQDPNYYLDWYLLVKPYLFWDWAVRIGAGDIYALKTENSPFDRYPILRGVKNVASAINPFIFILSIYAMLIVVWRCMFRGEQQSIMPVVPAALLVYVTAIYVLLQAEPRYSIPFKPIEILLACWASAHIGSSALGLIKRVRVGSKRIPQSTGSGSTLIENSLPDDSISVHVH
jgi:4-amino-4-deoxy-L-arabinose transferase-like glycosyltransferase